MRRSDVTAGELRHRLPRRGGDDCAGDRQADHGSEYKVSVSPGRWGRVGSCFDNVASEKFHSRPGWRWRRTSTATNRLRRHGPCAMHSPIEYEAIPATAAPTTSAASGRREAGLHDRRSPDQRSTGSRHRSDDRLDHRSATLHASGASPVRGGNSVSAMSGHPTSGGCQAAAWWSQSSAADEPLGVETPWLHGPFHHGERRLG
jgi:hypothetical protein